ncbi:MAG: thioredoxin domain-containing protein [Candidatus Thermoplasmatota archaeon]|nr:thioredoxin domain-containing protein [Candidatus Thermoplasmatota archaeon]
MNVQKNHLMNEKSPYLLQHVHNPVDWYPWSNEAFALAKKKNKPIFLSIGYSTCHWCHVMAHESFEDKQVAVLLNEHFICIKVDREERPDIDKIYMNVCHLITGGGGWPLTIIMTPDKKPFFAATYIPKETRYGMKGLLELIPEIKNIWEKNNKEVVHSAEKITTTLQMTTKSRPGDELTHTTLDTAYNQLLNSFDERYGGFGSQPKFPTPHHLLFLLRYWKRTGNVYSLKMVETTLEQMRQGGIYDHIGFGFHRYSTDKEWRLPHFEKMLYDQALLITIYTEAYQATRKQVFKKTAEEIIDYVLRDMTSEEGGFYSAEDADSDGMEGKFYLWRYDEVKKILPSDEFDLAVKYFDIKKEGNFKQEGGISGNLNIFHQPMSGKDFAHYYKITEKDLFINLERIRKKLYRVREQTTHPEKDDKILTDWNGLMIAALAKAAQVFDKRRYVESAEKALNFIIKNMMKPDGELLHRTCKQESKISGYADDYAFLILGLIELYQATFTLRYLEISLDLTKYLIHHFWDERQGGLFFTSDANEKLIDRTKETYDGAIPSANSISFYNFIRLARITGNTAFEQKAREISKAFSDEVNTMPSGYTQMISGLDFAIGPSYEIVIVGNKDTKDTQEILQRLHSMYQPNTVIILKEITNKEPSIVTLVPLIEGYSQIDNKATIYLCKNQQCQQPITNIDKINQFFN